MHIHRIYGDINGDLIEVFHFCNDDCHQRWCYEQGEEYVGWDGCHEGGESPEWCDSCGEKCWNGIIVCDIVAEDGSSPFAIVIPASGDAYYDD